MNGAWEEKILFYRRAGLVLGKRRDEKWLLVDRSQLLHGLLLLSSLLSILFYLICLEASHLHLKVAFSRSLLGKVGAGQLDLLGFRSQLVIG